MWLHNTSSGHPEALRFIATEGIRTVCVFSMRPSFTGVRDYSHRPFREWIKCPSLASLLAYPLPGLSPI